MSAGCAIDQHPNTGAFLLAQLDVGAMRTVSKVLAQSVALRHYHDKVGRRGRCCGGLRGQCSAAAALAAAAAEATCI